MAWSDNNDNKKQDPWGDQGGQQGPPDLDQAFRKLQSQFKGMFSGGGGGGDSGSSDSGGGKKLRLSPWLFVVVLLVVVGIWAAFGIYQLDAQEQAVVLRLGKAQTALKDPGLNWNPPIIDVVVPVNVTKVNSLPHSAMMLTEDENIIAVDLVVQYRVANAKDYVIQIRDPEKSLEHATESALRHVVGSSQMDGLITEGREVLGDEVMTRIQQYINEYKTGIRVSKVNIDSVGPPAAVQEAFDDVQKAKEDQVKFVNNADAFAAQVIPEARGDAQRLLEEANGYRERVIAMATGEADRFKKLLKEYQAAPEVTRDRLYITALESVMTASSKVMVDVQGGNNVLLLPLDQLQRNASAANTSAADALLRSLNPDNN